MRWGGASRQYAHVHGCAWAVAAARSDATLRRGATIRRVKEILFVDQQIRKECILWSETLGKTPFGCLGHFFSRRSTDKEGVHSLVRDSWEDALWLSGTLLLPKQLVARLVSRRGSMETPPPGGNLQT
ncbi:hypothetical protein Taro_013077 [Colocasia esculenta]|uniref:Uncharacterized protein n=1 Tax=Colocasia esculenta TaxID=4460 RepID=A0A843UEM3_COLES|nr:hypothetical protein [Colocasia esculenta]